MFRVTTVDFLREFYKHTLKIHCLSHTRWYFDGQFNQKGFGRIYEREQAKLKLWPPKLPRALRKYFTASAAEIEMEVEWT